MLFGSAFSTPKVGIPSPLIVPLLHFIEAVIEPVSTSPASLTYMFLDTNSYEPGLGISKFSNLM